MSGRTRLSRLRRPVARRVALREQAVEHLETKLAEFADGAAENVRLLELAEHDLAALEEEVFALVEVALERDPQEGLPGGPPAPPVPGRPDGEDR